MGVKSGFLWVSPDFRRFYIWLRNRQSLIGKIMGPLAFDRHMFRIPSNQISEFSSNRKWVKWTGSEHLFEVKSGFSRVYVLLQHIKVGMANITGSHVFNRYMSRVPWCQISELTLNRKWVKSEPQMGIDGGKIRIFVGFPWFSKVLHLAWERKKYNDENYGTTCIRQT